MLVRYNSVFVPLCSPNTCKDVFNPNVTAFQSNCAEGLHFSAFHFSCNDKPVAAVTVGGMVVGGLEVAVGRVSGKNNDEM